MATSTINGNVGGSNAQNAHVTCYGVPTGLLFAQADASGNYSFASLPAGTYVIKATSEGITSGPLVGYVYRSHYTIVADGSTTYSAVNLNPTAPNADNSSSTPTF